MGQDNLRPHRSPDELRARAAQFREMARGALSVAPVPALLRLADRYEALAEAREQEQEEGESLES